MGGSHIACYVGFSLVEIGLKRARVDGVEQLATRYVVALLKMNRDEFAFDAGLNADRCKGLNRADRLQLIGNVFLHGLSHQDGNRSESGVSSAFVAAAIACGQPGASHAEEH